MLKSVSLSKRAGRELKIALPETAIELNLIEIRWRKLKCGCLTLPAYVSLYQIACTLLGGLKAGGFNTEMSLRKQLAL